MLESLVISIGNSDNKLSQQDWSSFCSELDYLVRLYAFQVHFYGHGLPDKPWQNATWLLTVEKFSDRKPRLHFELEQIKEKYNQDSIFWQCDTGEFI